MFISDFAIRRPIITIVSMVALSVFGVFALMMLDTDEFPDVSPPIVAVSIPYPGASPDTVEREVIDPIEEQISGISGVKKVQSNSLDSYGVITVEFVFAKDLQEATQDIRDAISQIRNDLPTEMEEPILTRFDPNDFPIVQLTLASKTLTGPELTRIVDPGITRQLRGVTGVAEVNMVGGIEREMTIELDPQALQAIGVGVGEVVQAVQSQNLAAPVGRLNNALEERTIRLKGRLDTSADFMRLVVAQRSGRLIRLSDVAAVKDGTEEPRTAAVFNGRDAVGLDIIKADGYSTTDVSERVRARVDEVRKTLPPGVELLVARDAGPRVANSVADVQSALVEGAALTVLVVFLFLNSWRSTVITGLALPVSVLASFVAVWAYGFTLNTMSLLGLSLAIGILIDDAIVVRENIVRHVEMGKDHYTASREGTAEIGLAVAATTFSIVVVFVPIAFMGDLAGQWFKPFALTIAISVLVSLFVSFSLDPMLSAYWADPDVPIEKRSFISRGLHRFNQWFDRQAERYKKVIGWALDHRLAMTALAILSFAGALALPMMGVVGGGFFPDSDDSEFLINIETPPGSNLEYTKLKSEEAARLARAMPDVSYTYTTIGGRTGAVDEAIVYVKLPPKSTRSRLQPAIEADLRAKLVRLGGVDASIGSGNFENQKQIQLQLQGPDSRELNRVAQLVRAEVEQVPGAVDVGLSTRGQKPEIEVALDRGLAGSVGVTVGQVAQALRVAFAGLDSGDWIDPSGETRDVYVRLKPEARTNVRDLASLPLFVPGRRGTRRPRAARPGGAHLERARTGAHRSPRSRARHRHPGEHREAVAQRSARRHQCAARREDQAPCRLSHRDRRRERGSGRGVRTDLRVARPGGAADVLRARHPVRLVPRAAGDHAVAAAVAHRRDARAAHHGLDHQHHEHDWRHPVDGHRREERHSAGGLREMVRGAGTLAASGHHRGRACAPAPDSHDHLRAHRGHGADRDRGRRRRRLPAADGRGHHRRRHHLHVADAPRHPDALRDPHGVA